MRSSFSRCKSVVLPALSRPRNKIFAFLCARPADETRARDADVLQDIPHPAFKDAADEAAGEVKWNSVLKQYEYKQMTAKDDLNMGSVLDRVRNRLSDSMETPKYSASIEKLLEEKSGHIKTVLEEKNDHIGQAVQQLIKDVKYELEQAENNTGRYNRGTMVSWPIIVQPR